MRVFRALTDAVRDAPLSFPRSTAWWCNGSTGDFDSPSHGSNPCRAAIRRAPLAHGLRPAKTQHPPALGRSLTLRRMALSTRSASNGLVGRMRYFPTGHLLEPHAFDALLSELAPAGHLTPRRMH